MPLEKRFYLLEEFLEKQDKKSLELCRFAKVASGYRCNDTDMQKYSKSSNETEIWHRHGLDKGTRIKRCINLNYSFNAADFWLNPKAKMYLKETTYIFKLYYGRNVADIIKK